MHRGREVDSQRTHYPSTQVRILPPALDRNSRPQRPGCSLITQAASEVHPAVHFCCCRPAKCRESPLVLHVSQGANTGMRAGQARARQSHRSALTFRGSNAKGCDIGAGSRTRRASTRAAVFFLHARGIAMVAFAVIWFAAGLLFRLVMEFRNARFVTQGTRGLGDRPGHHCPSHAHQRGASSPRRACAATSGDHPARVAATRCGRPVRK